MESTRLTGLHLWTGLLMGALLSACSSQPITMYPGGSDGGAADLQPISGCTSDTQCSGATPRCDKNANHCVPCLPLNDNCPQGSRCVQSNDTFRCSTACLTAADCPKSDGGAPRECCNGVCLDTASDTNNCGGCGRGCPQVANATSVCAMGVCGIGACTTGFANCDGMSSNGCETDTTSDAKNCAGCGKSCGSPQNAMATCQSSACAMLCNKGFSDCDKDLSNGCEINVATDLKNCGGCGVTCGPLSNAVAACAAGACTVGFCNMGFSDCNNNAQDGCEASTQSDAANCGACGKACPQPANASASCRSGNCGLGTCNMGFADCDAIAANGCETPVTSDAKNCGGCGRSCSAPNGTPGCANGSCTVTACNPGFADCDMNAQTGCEVNVSGDVMNCGGCGKACPAVPNGTALCMNGVCMAGSCKFGFADCNMNVMDGCESNLLSPQSCGQCGNACVAPQNASAGCNGGMCGIGACNPLYGNCDGNSQNGCERSLASDVSNCGACNKVCPAPNGTPGCLMGQCGLLACNNGFADCDMIAANGCEAMISSDPKSCGQCNNVCPGAANATASCSNSSCGLTCNFGFADCDKMSANGCELNVQGDLANCGQCGNQCMAVANGTPACKSGTCGVGTCNGLYGDCDGNPANGCEKSLATDVNNCGACGNKCSFANAMSGCLNGQCGLVSCNQGFADCDGILANGCEVNLNTDAKNCSKCGAACPVNLPSCGGGACVSFPVVGVLGNQTFYKVPVTGFMTDTNVYNACAAAGFGVGCQAMGNCMYNDNLCVMTQEAACGNPMQTLSQKICNGASPPSCGALYGLYQYMGQKWTQNGSCGAEPNMWCAPGSSAQNRFALCVK